MTLKYIFKYISFFFIVKVLVNNWYIYISNFYYIKNMKYTVKTGDNLWKIARRFGTTIEAIMRANPWIDDPDYIQVGWVLKIPV